MITSRKVTKADYIAYKRFIKAVENDCGVILYSNLCPSPDEGYPIASADVQEKTGKIRYYMVFETHAEWFEEQNSKKEYRLGL